MTAPARSEVEAAMVALDGAILPLLVGAHDPRALAVALGAILGGMTAVLHERGQLAPSLAGSLGIVQGWVGAGVHGSVAARCEIGGRA